MAPLGNPGLGLAQAVLAAESSNRDLTDPAVLRALGEQVLAACQRWDCSFVVAASRSAEPIVTAALLIGEGEIRTQRPGAHLDRVMVVDSAIVTGQALHWTASDLREQGALWIGATVVRRVRPDLDDLDELGLFDSLAELHA